MPAPPEPARTRWLLVCAAIASGVVAALQVGQVPPTLPLLREEFALSLVAGGWIASTFNVIGAALGVLSGVFADRLGGRRALILGLALLALGGLAGALAGSFAALLASRVCAGVGLVLVAVAAPREIVAASRPHDCGLTLGAWSVYVPAGMAGAMLAAPLALPVVGWRGLWAGGALLAGLLALLWLTAGAPGRRAAPVATLGSILAVAGRPGPWLLGALFGCYTLQWFAMMTWLPTFLIETQGRSVANAALLGALVVGANLVGNVSGARALHAGVQRWVLAALAFGVMGISALGVFASPWGPSAGLWLALAFSAGGGLLPAAVMAGAGRHAPTPAQVGVANGFVVQGSHIGTVTGPPLLAAMVGWTSGWQTTWVLMLACGCAGLLFTLALRRIEAGE